MTRLTSCPDAASVADRAAAVLQRLLEQAMSERGVAHLALSGGTTPAETYRRLAAAQAWDGIEIWFADERCVGPEHPDSNFRLAGETLLAAAVAGVPSVHRMQGELGPEEGAARYASLLRERVPAAVEGGLPALDAVVLGIGPDGHVASLFPGSPALDAGEQELCLGIEHSPKPPPRRITLSLPALRAARSCVLLATGASKSDAVSAMLADPTGRVPASLLRRERLTVIVDDAAAPPAPPA